MSEASESELNELETMRYVVLVGDRAYYSGPDKERALNRFCYWSDKYPDKLISVESRQVLVANKCLKDFRDEFLKTIAQPR